MPDWTFAGVLPIASPRGGRQQDGSALPATPAESTVRAGSVRNIGFLRKAVGKLDAVLRWIHRVREFSGEPECLLRTSQGRAPTSVFLAEGIYVLRGSEILDLHLWNEHLPRLSSRSMGLALANTWRRQLAGSLSELVGQLNSDPRFRGIVALRARTALVPSARLPKLLRVACTFGFAPPSSVGCEPSRWRLGELLDALLLALLAWAFNPSALRRNGLWRQQCDLWISRHALEARYGRSGGDRKRANLSSRVPQPTPFRARYICNVADRRAPAGPAECRVIAAGCLARGGCNTRQDKAGEYFYLDIGPMVRRLRQNPTEFELRDKSIHHRPSSIRFILTGNGNGRIIARCNGIEFPISREQGAVLRAALATWKETSSHSPIDHGARRRVMQGGRELARLFVAKAQWRRLIGAMFAWFDISARRRHKRGSRPNLRLISSLSEDTTSPAGAKSEPGKPALSLLVSLGGDGVPGASFPLRPNPSSTAAKTCNK